MSTKVKQVSQAPDGSMTLTGHVKELRNRLVICALVFAVGTGVFLANASTLVDLLADMGLKYGYRFVTLAPQEKLLAYFKMSVLFAVIVTIPVILYHVWSFAKPGLKRSESAFFGLVMAFGLMLFCVGVAFAYKISLPFMLNFLINLEGASYIEGTISIQEYLNFVTTIFIIFGSVFEIPLVTVILAKMGIASPQIMRKGRGIAIVLCFFVAAVITPPDIVSQIMVGLPMVLLYEISIGLSMVFYKPHKDEEDDEDDEDEDED